MKTKALFIVSAVTLTLCAMGSDCINSPFIVSVNLDPISGCFDVDPGSGTWNSTTPPVSIRDLIDDSFKEGIVGYRLYDIRIRVTDDYPDGTVNGTSLAYSFDCFSFHQVITGFGGPSSAFKGRGVSLLDPQGLITYNPQELQGFVNALNDPNNPPESVCLYSSGNGPVATPGVQVCIDVFVQADAEVN